MAIPASISALTDELVATVAKVDKRNPRFKILKRRTEDTLRANAHGRTNQFAVAKQLEGLQEKFQVLNKDDLADALRARLTELNEHRDSWFPEILSLLLQLADRPAQLSKVDRIERLKPQEQVESLSWTELDVSGTAYCEEDIWESVDFGAGSSEDDLSSVSSDSYHGRSLPQTSIALEEDYVIPEDLFSSGEDEDLVDSIKSAQSGEMKPVPTLTDMEAIPLKYSQSFRSQTLSSLLSSFCSIGSKIDILRRYNQVPRVIPYLQTFHRGIEDRLREFDGFLSNVQSQYLSQSGTIAVSLLQLYESVLRESKLLLLLAEIVSNLRHAASDSPVRCLDLLYDSVCMTQATGDENEFRFLAQLFFSCFETYARPIRLWMEKGELEESHQGSFFIRDNRNNDQDLRTLWHGWYTLDESAWFSSAPKFVQPVARKIFVAGKSMVFLRHLDVSEDETHARKSSLTLGDVFPEDSTSVYMPFSALLDSAFGRIVDENHSFTSSLLRRELDQQCGLGASLHALEHIYHCKDMSVFGPIDLKIFDLIDRGRGAWDDRYLLTELAQSAFSTLPFIDPSRIIVRSSKDPTNKQNTHSRSVKLLQAICFDYILPWPVANIITKDAMLRYQHLSTFLMQIRRAKHTIVKQRLQYSSQPRKNAQAFALRHHMLWFLNTLYSHITDFVISTTTTSLRKDLSACNDVDTMVSVHQSYMSSLEDQCLLSQNLVPLYEAIISLLDLCIAFSDLQATRYTQTNSAQKEYGQDKDQSDEEEDEDEEPEHDDRHTPVHESQYLQQVKTTQDQFNQLVGFLAAGLKGVGRANAQVSWEILAERLEWRKERTADHV
ncbi:putative gamma-tubulin complex component GCP5 [Aspergillus nomiae NRRL 13137]|uniref:Spindle pole body component n=1 Tax=Aspergillus nomiae NRRL (strain ATCC 15546 / NRRL 13137 / CBS 260.88 / M93) TaxID=1509407 RepID=A0A0L1IRR6_ASPN3|nr:putative gamma-tubulin complex component GCP5 [Aspergillus nomiae NRRL 13137]KNG81893.1 putative gamma-tubulin complex component GCP5 [Aspergillus nomiae NRRL 13137]